MPPVELMKFMQVQAVRTAVWHQCTYLLTYIADTQVINWLVEKKHLRGDTVTYWLFQHVNDGTIDTDIEDACYVHTCVADNI